MRWTDLEASDVLLKEQRDRAPVSMWTNAMARHLLGGLRRESGIVHELEVVKVRQATVVLGSELRLWQAKRYSDTFEQLESEGVQFFLEAPDHVPVLRQNRRQDSRFCGGVINPFVNAESLARIGLLTRPS